MFFDIHTHNNALNKNVDKIVNIFPDSFIKLSKTTPNIKYSAGIHPCFISKKKSKIEVETIKTLLKEKNISAIGEIGIDRHSKTSLEVQLDIFIKQLRLAEEFDKPVIIHCVKCHAELLNIRKKFPDQKWIIHGFRGKSELAKQLLSKNIYLSFGHAVITPSPSLYNTLKKVPLNRIFLETDDSILDIRRIYEKVSEIKEVNIDSLINAVNLNKLEIFEN